MSLSNPIFVFASGWRTGSTLLQRLLCSHPEIHIWGENHGLMESMERWKTSAEEFDSVSQDHFRNYEASQEQAWIAMMNPPLARLEDGLRNMLQTYYGETAAGLGKARWGFKEVRYGAKTVDFLHRLFPEARFLLLVRNPADCLASARATRTFPLKKGILAEVGGSSAFLKKWQETAGSFRRLEKKEWCRLIRYEDLRASPDEWMATICTFLDVKEAMNAEVFQVRRRGWLGRKPRLELEDRQALDSAALWTVAGQFGYGLSEFGGE